MKPLDIAIIGYGTAGQAASLYLQRAGHRIHHVEQVPELRRVAADGERLRRREVQGDAGVLAARAGQVHGLCQQGGEVARPRVERRRLADRQELPQVRLDPRQLP